VDIPFASNFIGEIVGFVATYVDANLALQLLQRDSISSISRSACNKMLCSTLQTVYEPDPSTADNLFDLLRSRLPEGEDLAVLFREFSIHGLLETTDDVFLGEDERGQAAGQRQRGDGKDRGDSGDDTEEEVVEMLVITPSEECRASLVPQMAKLLKGPEGAENLVAWNAERIREEDQSTPFFVRCLTAGILTAAAESGSFLEILKGLCVVLSDVVRRRKDLQINVLLEIQGFVERDRPTYTNILADACSILSRARVAQPSIFVAWRKKHLGDLATCVDAFVHDIERFKDDDQ
jgi:hypothetical protein